MSNHRYSAYPCSFVHAGGTLSLTQIGGATLSSGSQINEIVPSGSVDRAAAVLAAAEASAQLTTQDLATVFAAVSAVTGLACTGNCTFQFQRRASSGVFAGNGANVKALATKGFLAPASLSASGDAAADLSLNFWALWDGTNAPIAFTNDQNLSGSPGYVSQFYLGPAYLGSTQLEGLLGTTVEFGIGFSPKRTDGVTYAPTGSIVTRRPTLRLNFQHLDLVYATLASMFHASVGSTLSCYFRKGVHGGVRVADNVGSHCAISASAGTWNADTVGAQGEEDGTASLIIRPTGTLSLSIASTIPAS